MPQPKNYARRAPKPVVEVPNPDSPRKTFKSEDGECVYLTSYPETDPITPGLDWPEYADLRSDEVYEADFVPRELVRLFRTEKGDYFIVIPHGNRNEFDDFDDFETYYYPARSGEAGEEPLR